MASILICSAFLFPLATCFVLHALTFILCVFFPSSRRHCAQDSAGDAGQLALLRQPGRQGPHEVAAERHPRLHCHAPAGVVAEANEMVLRLVKSSRFLGVTFSRAHSFDCFLFMFVVYTRAHFLRVFLV